MKIVSPLMKMFQTGGTELLSRLDTIIGHRVSLRKDSRARAADYDSDAQYRMGEKLTGTASEADLLQLYRTLVWAFRGINAIAMAVAQLPVKLYREKAGARDNKEPLPADDELWDVFQKPNPSQSWFDAMEHLVSFLLLSGDGYLERVGKGWPTELWPLRPDRMKTIPSRKSMVERYQYEVNRNVVSFQPSEVVHVKTFSPFSEVNGMGALEPAALSAALELYMIRFDLNYFKRGGRVGGVFETEQELGDEAFKRLQ